MVAGFPHHVEHQVALDVIVPPVAIVVVQAAPRIHWLREGREGGRGRTRETETETERQRQRDTDTDSRSDRQTERQTDTQADRQREPEREHPCRG